MSFDLKNKLIKTLQKDLPISHVQLVKEMKTGKQPEILSVVLFKENSQQQVSEILNSLDVKTIELPSLEVTIKERLIEIQQQIEKSDTSIAQLGFEAQKLASNIKNLKIIFDFLTWEKEKLANQAKAGNTWQTFSLISWIDQDKIKTLEFLKRLEQLIRKKSKIILLDEKKLQLQNFLD